MEKIEVILKYYKKYIKDLANCWTERTFDHEFGGYLTSFSREWNLTSTDKGCWGQGRQVYTFSELYELFDKEEKFKLLAENGKRFVLDKMYAGAGRYYYLVDRTGENVLDGTISIFSDAFAILGLAKYINVFGGTEEDVERLKFDFDVFSQNVRDENFKDIAPNQYEKDLVHHPIFMIAVNVCFEVSKVVENQTDQLLEYSFDKIFNVLTDENDFLYEKRMKDKSPYNGKNAFLVNVGHVFESMWFCLEVAIEKNDTVTIEKIIRICENTHKKAYENEDRVFTFSTEEEKQTLSTWKYEIEFDPTDKVSWSYAEEMYLWALLYKITDDEKYFDRLWELFLFTKNFFEDKIFGDWFHAIDKNNIPIHDFKGSTVKSLFHISRAITRIIRIFE